MRNALQIGGIKGWTQYITQYVETDVADKATMFDATLTALVSNLI